MAFIGESREDLGKSWSVYLCLDKSDSEIVLKAIGPLIGRSLKTYEYYKDILESGEATDIQTNKLLKAEENYNNIINLRNELYKYLQLKRKD